MIIPVVLAGGAGTRLWPLSRRLYPKQLFSLVSDHTLLQETLLRACSIPDVGSPLIICHEEHRFLVAEQVKQLNIKATIILESIAKNTAPALAIAAVYLEKIGQRDAILLAMPADHFIPEKMLFLSAINKAIPHAVSGQLVTFGVTPTRPEVGYGYIKQADLLDDNGVYRVSEFVEKPDVETAKYYIHSGNYFWNSGIFLFQTKVFLSELDKFAPLVSDPCRQAMKYLKQDFDFCRLDGDFFSTCPSESIDYAVMEKTQNAVVVPLEGRWSDVGSWTALAEVHEPDVDGNVLQGDIITEHVRDCYLRAESRMLAVVGVTDHVVIETPDAVLVAHKQHVQEVKQLVERLKKMQRSEVDLHHRVYRPWGYYETIDKSKTFQVKHIMVNPGATLSLQLHYYRSEHWVVVRGTAEVTRDNDVFILHATESTDIPQGVRHRLANHGTEHLHIIEVQSGSYLGEDDIVRFEDGYGRVTETS